MYRRWIYMCLVFYLTLETSYSQCYDDKTCECHCNCCSNCLGFYCTSCNREGWSGLTANGCQRKNIAYNQTTYQKSTNTDSSNAVDEKISTYSRTEVQKNPWIKVKFDKIQRVKHMFITLSAGIGSYFVYVKNSSNENLDRESLCARIQNNERQSLKWNITCKNDQAITGDQIVILRETTRGSLIVYDIKVFQCSTGTYGYLCDKTCVKCMDNQCDGFTGVCIKGCKSGWYGDRCDVECPSDCESGSCASGNNCTRCLPGYHGIFCNGNCFKNCYNCTSGSYDCEACKPGFYGSYCQYDCSSKCLTCDSADSCTSCRESWSGSSCQCNSKCADGCGNNGKCWNGCNGSFYGDYYDIPCPSDSCEKCDQKLGNCTECTKGRYGIHCDMDCIGSVVLFRIHWNISIRHTCINKISIVNIINVVDISKSLVEDQQQDIFSSHVET
ncbi:neurogenic locus notch homolog protein 1-like isoform X1 [Ostrea edulis]|uniref:neurogenic locus notch homolog protein 1-like isoform X1 n=1 Tax=Ostrea edulis TaxID=37623 RepID=UPI0024AF25C9|nr:neurogenic locus notch homolog protein 1-like isoform X1 [Ostrea edulis]